MIIIGEKLNGSIPAVADAIAHRDADFIRARACMQAQAGADYLDICASVAVSDEVETLKWMIDIVQEATTLPICLDSPNPDAIAAAIPFCKREGMINSVSLEGRKIDVLFPAIANTGWRCVALLCDDTGIPDSVDRRITVLENIMRRAEEYHIAPERLFIDPLVVALSTDTTAFATFSACAREIRRRYPAVHITSGLSNISFGLPSRKFINQAFLVLAMQAGMDSAIIDPTSREMRGLRYAADALLSRDAFCLSYIGASETDFAVLSGNLPQGDAAPAPAPDAEQSHLAEIKSAVMAGQMKTIEELVTRALSAGADPNAILNDAMIEAMSEIGERFTRGEAFVPEMLVAARTMKKGVEVLKPSLAAGAAGALGKVVIGTVAGDLHDIGKNLVAMMLESAGFTVLDLGVDVPAERFIAAIMEHPDVKIVALSTLLTTTMPAMQGIVQTLHALENRRFKIIVGGAPVTEAFAAAIGADGYSPDAAAAAVTAKALVQ